MVTAALQASRSARRTRRLKRRFSSASTNGTWKGKAQFLSPTPSSITRGRTRPASSSPSATQYFSYAPNALSLPDSPVNEEPSLAIDNDLFSLRDKTFLSRVEEPRRRTYASLPPTPILPSSPSRPSSPLPLLPPAEPPPALQYLAPPPFSLWDYLREELLATDFDSHQELKWERVSNFLSIPLAIEKVR